MLDVQGRIESLFSQIFRTKYAKQHLVAILHYNIFNRYIILTQMDVSAHAHSLLMIMYEKVVIENVFSDEITKSTIPTP